MAILRLHVWNPSGHLAASGQPAGGDDHRRVWDQNDLIDQFLAVYDRLDEELPAEIPPKRLWAVATQKPSEE